MRNYRISNEAKADLIRIYLYGCEKFGVHQADKYYHSLFKNFEEIALRPYSFESVDYIREGYRRCVHGPDSNYFKIDKSEVLIMAIIGKQDLGNILVATH